jgi:hypothetical protein
VCAERRYAAVINDPNTKRDLEQFVSNGKGGVFLKLSPDQYAKLKGG